jgi:hypothetical protein
MSQKLTFLCMLAVLVLSGTEVQAAEGRCNASGDQANVDRRRVREFFREEIRVSQPDQTICACVELYLRLQREQDRGDGVRG